MNSGKHPAAPRRKRLLVNPRFQTIFALYATLTTLVMVPIFVAANYYFFNLFAVRARALGLPPDHEILHFVDRQDKLIILVFIIATLLAIIINIICSYVFSHRIAGSIYRLTTSINQAIDVRSANKVQARDNDFFKEVFDAYNQLLDRSQS